MKRLIQDIANYQSIYTTNNKISDVISQINGSPSHIKLVFNLLLKINTILLILFQVFGFEKIKLINFIFKNRPPFLFMIYRLIHSLLILSSNDEK